MTAPATSTALQPQRAIDDLKELRSLTGNADGEQRVCWTDTWAKGRDMLRGKLAQLPVEVETDQAGNLWATLRGKSDRAMLLGGHMDSVPNGGWLDGCLNVLGALEVLRRIASEGTPPVTVRLVDLADEEGARFGRSLFGSSAASATMNPDALRNLADKEGIKLVDAISKYGVNLDTAKQSGSQFEM